MDFLLDLRDSLRDGLALASAEYRARHARWLAAQEDPAGGFRNRRGNPELYYTTFALRALSALSALTPECAARAQGFLKGLARTPDRAFAEAVSAASWWDAWRLCEEAGAPALEQGEREALADAACLRLEALRRPDGGWAKTPLEGNGSLYHTFLAVCAFRRMGRPMPEAEGLRAFLKGLEQPAGGFLESRFGKRPGTNGTAAGVALSGMLEFASTAGRLAEWAGLQTALRPLAARKFAHHAAFLRSMQNEEGGFQATPGAPLADLLSTFTALFTLQALEALDEKALARAAAYAREREDPAGGYTGFALEAVKDCEYAFYGLGVESSVARKRGPAGQG